MQMDFGRLSDCQAAIRTNLCVHSRGEKEARFQLEGGDLFL